MKKVFLFLFVAILLSACGVGSYSVSSGKADEAMLSFASAQKTAVTVMIDNASYNVYTVKTKDWRKDRNIKKTAKNTISFAPGQHTVTVIMSGREVFKKKLFVSSQEHRIIEI